MIRPTGRRPVRIRPTAAPLGALIVREADINSLTFDGLPGKEYLR